MAGVSAASLYTKGGIKLLSTGGAVSVAKVLAGGQASGSGADTFTLQGASALSSGAVAVTTSGSIVLLGTSGIGTGTGGPTAASLKTTAASGNISIADGALSLKSFGDLVVAGDAATGKGGLAIAGKVVSGGNLVTVSSTAGSVNLAEVLTCDATCLAQSTGSGRLEPGNSNPPAGTGASPGRTWASRSHGGPPAGYCATKPVALMMRAQVAV